MEDERKKLTSAHSKSTKCRRCGGSVMVLTLVKGSEIVQRAKCNSCNYEKNLMSWQAIKDDSDDSIWAVCRPIFHRSEGADDKVPYRDIIHGTACL